MIRRIKTELFSIYHDHIFWRVRNKRGGTFLTNNLKKLLLASKSDKRKRLKDVEKTDEECSGIKRNDWDNLIILDACRHDFYEEVTGREVDYRISCSSVSEEYVKNNFSQGDWSDTVYINSNGFLTDIKLEEITGRKEIFHEKFDTIENKWDESITTVPPKAVREDAETANKLFPDKNLIIHFMQPHHRFLTNNGEEVRKSSKYSYDIANSGKADREAMIEAYKENIEIVMEHVEELIPKLEGKTIVTSDHGELLGENNLYGHFYDNNAKKLRKVPWDLRTQK